MCRGRGRHTSHLCRPPLAVALGCSNHHPTWTWGGGAYISGSSQSARRDVTDALVSLSHVDPAVGARVVPAVARACDSALAFLENVGQ